MAAIIQIPKTTKALVLRKAAANGKSVLHDAVVEERPLPQLKPGQILVRVHAAAFNHRDLWIRKNLYPGIGFGRVLGADAAGVVVASADKNDSLLQKRVFLLPMRGWEKDPDAPESDFIIVGASKAIDFGTFAQYIVVDRDQVIPTPDHLDDVHAAAWPLGGVTAWRATIVNGAVKKGDNVLITGIGGGVAILALQLAIAAGANVYVTSGSEEKIRKAIELGAKGGVSYKNNDWPTQLGKLLKENGKGLLSAVIDAGGGDILGKTSPILKQGGRVVVFGMHANPKVTITMREVMKNQKILGSTMGSHKDLIDATNFLAEHRIVPVVSHVLDGLESADEGFKLLQEGSHVGKIVIRIPPVSPQTFPAKL
ncbi:NAD(P)-binding protein [Dichomitus squalens LYAD-421 SS1]|uniref:NAD(P)-binding protein n=1 Tax=Dichomitus squalens (strain LYAD-421) TaxID=732165 RepID=UPI0004411E16|nr:NAD(P)-binding protein [Dichomitus squalens LYAD-421 SS1]EJF66218.1 NAD(P)-binding protein [Dichomitus squalens LYAD-421 SS1]